MFVSRSAMAAKTQKLEGRDAAFSSLNAAVEALNLAKEITGFAQAKAVFGSVGLLLTLIRVRAFLSQPGVRSLN